MVKREFQRTKCLDCGRYQIIDESGRELYGDHRPLDGKKCDSDKRTRIQTFSI